MLINLSDVLNTPGKEAKTSITTSLESFSGSFGEFKVKDFKSYDIKAVGIEKGKARVSGQAQILFEAQCDRCLNDAQVFLDIDFERECASPEILEDEDSDIHEFMDGYQLDAYALLYNEITVNWPVKILCREDCKGLCPVCGHDLNVGDCGCDTFVPDPRMAVLSDIFNSTKEV